MSHADAERRLHQYLANAKTATMILADASASAPTVNALAERFLAWVLEHRGRNAHRCRSCHLRHFQAAYGEVAACAIDGSHLEAFIASLRQEGYAKDYQQKHKITVGAMFNKGVRKGWLPPGIKPFASVEPIRLDAKPLLESDLPTDSEVKALFNAADADPHGQMGDFDRLYHATGARTHELIEARVSDFQRNGRTIVLGKHKRSHTMKEATPRTITLNAQAYAILERPCPGRKPSDTIFVRPKSGKAMARFDANQYFRTVRDRAGLRDKITVYSLRHLWISEMLMAGVDVLLVARMAGTSVKMIETVYGHFLTQSYSDAQARLDRERAARGL